MINTNPIYENMFNSAAREFVGRVELLEGSTLLDIFTHDGALISFTVDRAPSDNNKFFGYSVCQMVTVKLRDKERTINIKKGQHLQVAYGIDTDYLYSCPVYIIDEVVRDENTNDLTVTAYDPIYKASSKKVKDLILPEQFTLKVFAYACGSALNMPVDFINIPENLLGLTYTKNTANFSGDETIREALDDLAEMFGAVYYFCNNWRMTFRQLNRKGEPDLVIDKSKYFTLSVKTAHKLTNIASITELGDNVITTSGLEGETQYLRENAFLTLRDDIDALLYTILNAVQGLTLYQFECKHRGDFRLAIGDKISLTTKDNNTIHTYLLNDSTTYNGGLVSTTSWTYEATDAMSDTNPTTIGEALKSTYAKVDKVNQRITLMANDMDERIASLVITTDQIQSTVQDNTAGLQSQITQTAESIRSEVTDEVNGLNSKIEQTAGSITATVTDTKNQLESKIEQTAGSITSTVTDELNKTKTEIQQTTDSISQTVTSQGEVVAQLVLDIDGIHNMGYVTFTDLEGNGTTVINGSNITTGTISADRINMTGAISWGDLSQSCKNTIASYAGADGDDADVPDYIHNTYIDAVRIVSPTIQGGTISAGTSADGYMKLSSTGLNFHSSEKAICGIGYYSANKELPYIVLGAGLDSAGTDQGMIKKYTNGIWIGDSDSINASSPSAYSIGLFIDFTNGKMYRYNGSGTRAELV